MNRIDKKFKILKKDGRKAIITFVTAGDPNLSITRKLVFKLEEAGADIIELGIPYSDPIADGPIIQVSSERALKNGVKIVKIMDMVKEIREKSQVPLIYLAYYNSIFKYGIEKFLRECKKVGIDGLIIPDLPIEERREIEIIMDKYGVYLIPLVAPTSEERIKEIVKSGKGFVYCVTVKGITGVRNEINTNIKKYIEMVNSHTKLPKALGFGISSKKMAEKLSSYCDGIIIGSAIIKRINEEDNLEDGINSACNFVRDIKEGF